MNDTDRIAVAVGSAGVGLVVGGLTAAAISAINEKSRVIAVGGMCVGAAAAYGS
eukprot:CAMPEP_0174874414 /NCGR_PEP_ID=MMETSP1114-20130205/76636_1 /TAXON_ID=312471 /ORGANISM="Neobodo designis, Strain CCAP 1951/1" /LENGTH=53 /DNA_ID=CAMNT_0016109743 /DNA_START=89 /DNA_END=247 /DNA_ORIENTATION=+